MEQIMAILDKVVDTYDHLCTAQIWNSTNKSGPCATPFMVADHKCWNCNGTDHQASSCPKPCNKALYDKNYKSFKEAKKLTSKCSLSKTKGGGDKVKGTDYTVWEEGGPNWSHAPK